jgi:RNA polymerase primary sigma factor
LERTYSSTFSLDGATDERSTEISGLVLDESAMVHDDIDRQSMGEQIEHRLEGLGNREREIIRMRFGFSTPRALTLAEVARNFGISRERVRQIEKAALVKLSSPRHCDHLQSFLA